MTKIRREREGEGGGGLGGGKGGGAHRVLDHTYLELSVARATLVTHYNHKKLRQMVTKHKQVWLWPQKAPGISG